MVNATLGHSLIRALVLHMHYLLLHTISTLSTILLSNYPTISNLSTIYLLLLSTYYYYYYYYLTY